MLESRPLMVLKPSSGIKPNFDMEKKLAHLANFESPSHELDYHFCSRRPFLNAS